MFYKTHITMNKRESQEVFGTKVLFPLKSICPNKGFSQAAFLCKAARARAALHFLRAPQALAKSKV